MQEGNYSSSFRLNPSREEPKLKNSVETQSDTVKRKSFVREYSEAIIIAVILALFIRAFVVQAFKIPSGSMEPTLLIGDHILVNKFIYGIRVPIVNKEIIPIKSPKLFDIVVFRYPNDRSKDFIKRVIGLPLQKVQIINKKIYINDAPLNDSYGYFDDPHLIAGARDNFGPVVVPPHSYFVMGDNRDHSHDSRFWGFVDQDDLVGEAFIIYWSWRQEGNFSIEPSESFIRWNRFGKLLLQ
jgi:signal peptidase I